jgi:hypothetical protein
MGQALSQRVNGKKKGEETREEGESSSVIGV